MKEHRLPLIKQAIQAAQSNLRQSPAHTKTRGEVAGGGKKPWRQKGTGRARAGSSRSPIWVGGGITFGPRSLRNHTKTIGKKMSRLALKELLFLLQEENQLIIVDSLKLKTPKTKDAVTLLNDHKVADKRVTFVTKEIEPELIMACRNLPLVTTTFFGELGVLPLTLSQVVILEKEVAKIFGLVKEGQAVKTKAQPKISKRTAKKDENN